MRNPKAKSFTLIELLIVVAIIAVLVSILLPALHSARRKAMQAACSSNMKSIGSGFLQYSIDYDDYLPALYCGNTIFWPVSIRNYVGKPGRVLPTGSNHNVLEAEVHVPLGTYRNDIYLCPDYRSDPGGYPMRRTYVATVVSSSVNDGGFAWDHEPSRIRGWIAGPGRSPASRDRVSFLWKAFPRAATDSPPNGKNPITPSIRWRFPRVRV